MTALPFSITMVLTYREWINTLINQWKTMETFALPDPYLIQLTQQSHELPYKQPPSHNAD